MIILIFLCTTALSVYFFRKSRRRLETNNETTGVIVNYKSYISDSSEDRTRMYTPVIQFIDHHQKVIEFSSNNSSSKKRYEIGEVVKILYSPENSEDAIIYNFLSLWFAPVVAFAIGATIPLLSLISTILSYCFKLFS